MERVKELLGQEPSLAEVVKTALRERGLSVSELARRYDLHRGSVSEMLNLDRYPSPAFSQALATELGGTPSEWAQLFVSTWQAKEAVKIAA